MRRGRTRFERAAGVAAVAALGWASCAGPARPPSTSEQAAAPPARIVTTEGGGSRGGRLVFVDEDGRRLADLVPPSQQLAVDSNPVWSPDGGWVAFVSTRGRATLAESNLWLTPAAGGAARRLSRSPAIERDPRWLPGSRALVFASNLAGTFDLYRLELGGQAGALGARGAPIRLTTAPGDELGPTIAPDGSAVVYMAVDRATGRAWLESIPLAGGAPIVLTDGPADLTPAFSPDGRSIVFAAPVKGRGDTDLFAVAPDGRGRRVVLDQPGSDETGPVFSSDGRHLLATSVYRSVTGKPILSSVVVLARGAAAPVLRALHDPSQVATRFGVALAPGPLDGARLARLPRYLDAVRRVVEESRAAQPVVGPDDGRPAR